ncbi:MAG: murein biosynthesis integral membrane protein MurJ [Candidatus Devosia phytovorans]|uniref:Probable lipid II flippase MurJ n=1 Tax=Candidatus Devosia phytovorans TaxID=3121372 RepID=A0AAJ6AZR6_9HYPH|nr:murein biosynthesis integral membrane protein MurJ [Devosia sp.]WEK04116.1 MAG: murein biosynthesis integral membrane protein MurJ [Devosia sp.]
MSLYRNFLSVGGLTLLSRIAGFARDALMAAVLGIGPVADAFNAAFRFPNLFRRLFAEGAFNTAFVPMFSTALETQGAEEAKRLAGSIMSWLVAAILLVTLLAEVFMEPIMWVFVPGFDDPQKFELTVFLARIMFPYLACMSLMAAYAAILNTLGRFFASAFAPVILNIVNIAALVPLAILVLEDKADVAFWVAIATMLGGIAQLALVYGAIRRAKFVPRLSLPRPSAETRRFWLLAIPAIIAGGITQINILVGTVIASGAENAISILSYADRLYQLPLGIIGIAIGTVLLPELSRHLSAGRNDEAAKSQDQSLLLSMLLSLPAAAALAALSVPIVRVLFERGAFDAVATTHVAEALVGYAWGLPAFVLIRVLQPGFFSRKDTVTPTIFAGLSVIANIAISLALFPSLQHVGIALATTISSWLNAGLLALFLARRGYFSMPLDSLRKHALTIASSLIMAGALYLLGQRGAVIFSPGQPFLVQAAALFAICTFGTATYFTLVHITGAQKLGMLASRLRRRR